MKRSFLLLPLAAIFILGCQEEDENQNNSEYTPKITVNNDQEDLSRRISYFDESVTLTSKRSSSINLVKKAEVLPGIVDGNKLSATGVDVRTEQGFNHAYVSFHTRGEDYGGEILTLDITDNDQPVILQSLTDSDADFNDITVGQSYLRLWVAGDRSVSASGYPNTMGAVASKFWLNKKKIFDSPAYFEEAPLSSYSGNSMTRVKGGNTNCAHGAETWITSGSEGELRVLAACEVIENQPLHKRYVPEAKHFDYDGNRGVLLRGIDDNSCAIDVYDLDNRFTYETYTLPFDVTHLGKNGVDVVGTEVYLALGDDGIAKVDVNNGTVLGTYNYGGNGFANGVKVAGNYIFVANGSDGLVVLNKTSMSFVGRYDGGGSCNFVDVIGDYIYLANGNTGGFIILKIM